MMSIYTKPKMAFVDEIDTGNFIELESTQKAYDKLRYSIDKASKMILLSGRPGTGKSLLLARIYRDLKGQYELYYFDTPSLTGDEFSRRLFQVLTRQQLPNGAKIGLDTFVEYLKRVKNKRSIVVLIDEAQMYPREVLEQIRILSDTGAIKFIISLHKIDGEELITKEHFRSRVWEVVELKNATLNEQKIYIIKKLLQENEIEIADRIRDEHIKFINKYTRGNYRETNKMLYTVFELYEHYDRNDPSKIDHKEFSKKILEMAAIKLGYIDV